MSIITWWCRLWMFALQILFLPSQWIFCMENIFVFCFLAAMCHAVGWVQCTWEKTNQINLRFLEPNIQQTGVSHAIFFEKFCSTTATFQRPGSSSWSLGHEVFIIFLCNVDTWITESTRNSRICCCWQIWVYSLLWSVKWVLAVFTLSSEHWIHIPKTQTAPSQQIKRDLCVNLDTRGTKSSKIVKNGEFSLRDSAVKGAET